MVTVIVDPVDAPATVHVSFHGEASTALTRALTGTYKRRQFNGFDRPMYLRATSEALSSAMWLYFWDDDADSSGGVEELERRAAGVNRQCWRFGEALGVGTPSAWNNDTAELPPRTGWQLSDGSTARGKVVLKLKYGEKTSQVEEREKKEKEKAREKPKEKEQQKEQQNGKEKGKETQTGKEKGKGKSKGKGREQRAPPPPPRPKPPPEPEPSPWGGFEEPGSLIDAMLLREHVPSTSSTASFLQSLNPDFPLEDYILDAELRPWSWKEPERPPGDWKVISSRVRPLAPGTWTPLEENAPHKSSENAEEPPRESVHSGKLMRTFVPVLKKLALIKGPNAKAEPQPRRTAGDGGEPDHADMQEEEQEEMDEEEGSASSHDVAAPHQRGKRKPSQAREPPPAKKRRKQRRKGKRRTDDGDQRDDGAFDVPSHEEGPEGGWAPPHFIEDVSGELSDSRAEEALDYTGEASDTTRAPTVISRGRPWDVQRPWRVREKNSHGAEKAHSSYSVANPWDSHCSDNAITLLQGRWSCHTKNNEEAYSVEESTVTRFAKGRRTKFRNHLQWEASTNRILWGQSGAYYIQAERDGAGSWIIPGLSEGAVQWRSIHDRRKKPFTWKRS